MTLYLVHGNTYYYGYGHMEHIFGIYTDKDKAETAKKEEVKNEVFKAEKVVTEQLYEKEKRDNWSNVDNISDIEVEILEIEANEISDIELGGYCE